MAQNKNIKNIILALAIIVSIALSAIFFKDYLKSFYYKKATSIFKTSFVEQKEEPWMTIFVHGCFGSILGFLNFFQVVQDNVDKTFYKKVSEKMRKDPSFYQEQPILAKGLIPITPTFDLPENAENKPAAYPMIKSYEHLSEYVEPNKEKNYFYTFGWSGLISKKRRIFESIRFYNAINEEIEKLHKQGIHPKIRILAHSHGGNMVSYLAAIDDAITNKQELIPEIQERINLLTKSKEEAKTKKGQKQFDYEPSKIVSHIDEFIIFGMPVQPETEKLFSNSFFKKTYHFYSDEDLVQKMDWVSTKQRYSNRRFEKEKLSLVKDSTEKNKFVQARIKMSGKKIDPNNQPFLTKLLGGGSLLNAYTEDPTHKELWFFSWYNKPDSRTFSLAPMPVAVFAKAITKLINSSTDLDDMDINFDSSNKDQLKISLTAFNDEKLKKEIKIEKNFLENIKSNLKPWKPKRQTPEDVFSIMSSFIKP